MPRIAKVTRELWLQRAVVALEKKYFSAKANKLPKSVGVACGVISGKLAIGICYNPRVSTAKTTEIFISPKLEDPIEVLGTLLHELIHAELGTEAGHGKLFKARMAEVGLGGKATATVVPAGSELEKELKRIARELGRYPHKAMKDDGKKGKKVGKFVQFMSRNFKYKCLVERVQFEEHGPPLDPNGDTMIQCTPRRRS